MTKVQPQYFGVTQKHWCDPWSEYSEYVCDEGRDACIECFHVEQVLFPCLISEPAHSNRPGSIISELRCQATVRPEAGKLQATGMLWTEQEEWEEGWGWTSQLPPSASTKTSQQTCLPIGLTTSTTQQLVNYPSREVPPGASRRRLGKEWTRNSRLPMKQTATTPTTGQF